MDFGAINKQDEAVQTPVPFVGTFTREHATAAGTQSIIGVGFRPSYIIANCTVNGTVSASAGFDNQVNGGGCWVGGIDATSGLYTQTTSLIVHYTASSTFSSALIQSFDDNGFTLIWVKGNSPSGTIRVNFMAFK